ncbi:MAG TPA: glycosyltransferase, partial [Candidatus Limnocylindrales bacterium]
VVAGGPSATEVDHDPEARRLMAVADEVGVADRVRFLGQVPHSDMPDVYRSVDIVLATPWYEPFGITPLEAMACGTPVVGSNVGGIKFSVRDGETGYLVSPRDPDALAERIGHLYRHPKLLSVFARQAVRRVNDLFTWTRVAATVSELYDAVLAERRLARREVAEQLASVDRTFEESANTLLATKRRLRQPILDATAMVTAAFARDGRLLVAGNGGSMAEAQHLAAEFVGRFRVSGRPGLAAIALGAEPASMTAWANDVGYEDVLARQVEAFGRHGDVLVGLSTSGRSPNLVRAFARARELGLGTVAIVGRDGGELHGLADVSLVVPAFDTQRIQEVHGVIVHLLAELVEQRLADAGWFPTTSRAEAAAEPVAIEPRRERATARPRRDARLASGGRGGR